jgi:catechol 2,3-dioxygenase-like lactoylglutathione lyase family enzyme
METGNSGVTLQPMVHVTDMAASVALYEALGASVLHGSREGDFTMLQLGGARFSLLAHPPNPDQDEGLVELNFESTVPLEQVAERLREAGADVVGDPEDTGFGRQLQVRSPGGLLLKVNELQPERYT